MRAEDDAPDHPRLRTAITEMEEMIRARSPSATFAVAEGDDPAGVDLFAPVDLDDSDEVMDRVIDRGLDPRIDERARRHVIPLRTPARNAAAIAGQEARRRGELVPR